MLERKNIGKVLELVAQQLRELELLYEKYFSGVEKREPLKKREDLNRKIRQLTTRRIIQTDLRFRLESLSARYYSYTTHWDRILRLMDEGRYVRHLAQSNRLQGTVVPEKRQDESEEVYQQLLKAHQACGLESPMPDRQKFTAYLTRQRGVIQEKYGDREFEFHIVTEDGKPKIKARAKSRSHAAEK